MELSLTLLLAAFASGLFAAAIGGLPAFVFTGLAVLTGVAFAAAGSDFDFIGLVAFGPVFGPHISFAGAAAAAAFAARRGDLENGRDIAAPLAGVNDPITLIVGGLFGAGAYVVVSFLNWILTHGEPGMFYVTFTDTVALTVVISAIVARLAFGRTGLFGTLDEESRTRGRFVPGGGKVWVDYQQGLLQATILGLGAGLLSAWIVTAFNAANPDLIAAGAVLGFGISAVSLILLQVGFSCPVTHHMSLPAAVAAVAVLMAFGGGPLAAMIAGAIAGIAGALLGELYSRLFLIHGDTHVDPPACAIATMATIVVIITLLFA
ncbi:MAG TPA: hypothetical protein VKA51_00395 [Rubrobacteraceae bacterium]|nr:hypothetical protein [Rubrobacteraceae bacterium]